ncbi:ABC transporter permease [Desulfitobacterium sp. AusDCA]|uniref:ABC transporter permease n=1 Tax=Desulfitobacterium sp. AusDCA TaxID=3240383 RepID=UPI003DA799BE
MKQILTIAHYEVVHIFKDRILFLMVFLIPLLYALVFGMIYVSGTLQHVPLGIVDLSHSEESRSVVEVFENTPNFQVIPSIQTYADLEAGMKNGTVRAGIVIPEDYAQKLAQHQLTQILTVYDGSNLIYGYNTRKYLQQELNTFSTNHTAAYLSGLGMTKHEITNVMDTVSFRLQVWYNPTFSYATFIFIGLVIMILHQIGLLGIGLTVTREKERNSWIQFLCTDIPSWKIFLGKILPYFVINIFNYGLLLWIAARFIDVKIEGSLGVILLLGFLFNVILVSLGFVISLYAPNSLQVTRYLMLLSVPLFVLSGLTWPSTHIPKFLNALAQVVPYTWMANGIRQATVKSLGLADLRITVMVMTVMAAAITFFALTFTKRRNPPVQSGLSMNNSVTYPMKAR